MNISNTPYVNSTELPDGSLVFLADADARGGVRDLEETKASKESVEAIKTAMSGIDPEDATPGKTASVLGWQEYDSVPEVESTETDMASHPLFRASLLDPIVKRDDLVYDDSSKWQAEPKSVIGRIAGLGAKTEHLSAETERLSVETERLSAETERLSAETERLSAETERLDNGQEDLASMLQTVSERVPVKLSETFDMSVDAQFKDMCIAMARALGAVVTHTTDDTSTGGQVAQAYGITPTDATTFGELQTKAGLNDSDTLGDL